jgi:hypothetical protein
MPQILTVHEKLMNLRGQMRLLMVLDPSMYVVLDLQRIITEVSKIRQCPERTELLDDLVDYLSAVRKHVA